HEDGRQREPSHHFPSSGAAEGYYQTYVRRVRPDYVFGGFAGQRLLPRFHPDALACSSIFLRSSSLSFAIRLGFTRTRSSMTGSFSFSVLKSPMSDTGCAQMSAVRSPTFAMRSRMVRSVNSLWSTLGTSSQCSGADARASGTGRME